MSVVSLHCIRSLAGVAFFCLLAGCWQEIEYQPPPMQADSQRRPKRVAQDEIAEASLTRPPDAPSSQPADAIASKPPAAETPTEEPPRASPDAPLAEPSELPAQPLVAVPESLPEEPLDDALDALSDEPPQHIPEPPSHDDFAEIEDIFAERPAAAPAAPTAKTSGDDIPDFIQNTPSEPADKTATAPAPPRDEPPPAAAPVESTRLLAWQLGNKLSLAALARDRGVIPAEVAKWESEARAAAQALGTSFAELPTPAAHRSAGAPTVHDYLAQQGQRIWGDLSERQGSDHAALFEVAVKSTVLIVLYAPGGTAAELLAQSIREASPQAELPDRLWQPLLETLAKQPPAAEVRLAVRRLQDHVEQYLTAPAQP